LVDCFSSGKGHGDKMFLEFFKPTPARKPFKATHVENPADPIKLQDEIFFYLVFRRPV